MEKRIEDYQLVEVYDQGVWNTVWKKKEITHDPRAPKWARKLMTALVKK